MSIVLQAISTFLVAGGALLAWLQFKKAQQFKRLQNLTAMWEKFFREGNLRSLFALLNDIELGVRPAGDLATISTTDKLHYLAALDDVAIYAELGEVDERYAVEKFQWFFHYVFTHETIAPKFWENLGGEAEMKQPYWAQSRKFAVVCQARVKAAAQA
jgi:hypothetical protein